MGWENHLEKNPTQKIEKIAKIRVKLPHVKTALLSLQVQIHRINTCKNAPYLEKVTNKKNIKLEEIGKKT